MSSRPQPPWHTRALAATLGLWAIWMFVTVFGTAARVGWEFFNPRLLCIFISIPTLMGAGAYLLYTGNKLRFLPFLALPIMEFWFAIEFYPDQLNPQDWEIGPDYLAHFPLGVRLQAGFFVACAVYCLFLNRREGAYMASNNRSRGP